MILLFPRESRLETSELDNAVDCSKEIELLETLSRSRCRSVHVTADGVVSD